MLTASDLYKWFGMLRAAEVYRLDRLASEPMLRPVTKGLRTQFALAGRKDCKGEEELEAISSGGGPAHTLSQELAAHR